MFKCTRQILSREYEKIPNGYRFGYYVDFGVDTFYLYPLNLVARHYRKFWYFTARVIYKFCVMLGIAEEPQEGTGHMFPWYLWILQITRVD